MYFADVIGQEDLKKSLTRTVRAGQIAHAHMIVGMEGGGNLPLGLALAGYVFCENRGEEDRCGKCTACKLMNQLGHPDLHFSFPFIKTEGLKNTETLQRSFVKMVAGNPYLTLQEWEEEIGGENKKSIISVEESREIVHKLSLNSFMGGHKVMIIWMPEKLRREASNALLKTLEEPMGRTLIMLVTSHPETILPTIISRTQLTRCEPLSYAVLTQALIERDGATPEEARHAARFGEGSYRRAQVIAADGVNRMDDYFPLLRDWMRSCVSKNPGQALEASTAIAKMKKDDQHRFLEYALAFLHESVMFSILGPEKSRFEGSSAQFALKFAPYIVEKDLGGFHDVLNRAHYLVTRNANPNLLFMKTSYEMMKLFSNTPKTVAERAA